MLMGWSPSRRRLGHVGRSVQALRWSSYAFKSSRETGAGVDTKFWLLGGGFHES